MDVLTPAQRRLNMRRIRGRDTKPELLIRRGLHARGLRFRLQRRDLPGRPDLVFARQRAAIFVHGCFWHGHDCSLFRLPATNTDFWQTKILANRARDKRAAAMLGDQGWRILTIWECALKGRRRLPVETVLDEATAFIGGKASMAVIAGEAGSTIGPAGAAASPAD